MIAGFATDTIVVSTRIMKNPMTSAHRAGHGLTESVTGSFPLDLKWCRIDYTRQPLPLPPTARVSSVSALDRTIRVQSAEQG